jgi:hypothetical protein
MFLWLTSAAPASDCGGGAQVFDSTAFFDVSPKVNNVRTLVPHTCNRFPLTGVNRGLGLRVAQVGPHGLPVLIRKGGGIVEVEDAPTSANGKPVVFSPAGVLVELREIKVSPQGKAIFIDRAGKPIIGARPIIKSGFATPPVLPSVEKKSVHALTLPVGASFAQRFKLGGIPILIDPFGNVVELEQGQADTDGVLMSQGRSLVYFGITANDVYAYFLSGSKDGVITPTGNNPMAPGKFGPFPTTAADLQKITSFAASKGAWFPDPNALAVEIKTAWVDASTLSDPQAYVTMTAAIPTYTMTPPRGHPTAPSPLRRPGWHAYRRQCWKLRVAGRWRALRNRYNARSSRNDSGHF